MEKRRNCYSEDFCSVPSVEEISCCRGYRGRGSPSCPSHTRRLRPDIVSLEEPSPECLAYRGQSSHYRTASICAGRETGAQTGMPATIRNDDMGCES